MPECSGRCWCTKVVAERGRQCLAQCQGHVEEQRGIGGLTTVQSATVHSAGLTTSLPLCFRPNSWEHRTTFCSPQAAAVNIHSGSSAASSLVAVSVAICVCLLVSSLCGLEVEVPPLELCLSLNSAARLGSRSVHSPLESSTIMTHYNLHLRIGRRGTVWYCLVLSWIRAVLDGIGWY